MPQIINTNIASLVAQRNLNTSQTANAQAMKRLSSGLRINSAKDDAAGLAISTRYTSVVRGIAVAIRNAGDGISLAQTAEGALMTLTSNLQRIRELALQSVNATNSDADRQSINSEVQQLIAEIARKADTTNFNGTNLLTGELSTSFQIGTNAGETVGLSISAMTTDVLGSADSAGVSAVGQSGITTAIDSIGNGDLIINGVQIGPSSSSDDSASTANSDGSAIAKVATINKSTDDTGVVAEVVDNYVAGTVMVAAQLDGTITLNNVSIDIQTGAGSNAANRQAVVTAINAKSDQTGVTAVDTGLDSGGVALIAADGRNIVLDLQGAGGLTAAATGLADATAEAAAITYVGGYTLNSVIPGDDIVLQGGDDTGTGDIANAGLTIGTYSDGIASTTNTAQTTAAATAGSPALTLSAGDLVLNGVAVSAAVATDDTASDGTAFSDSLDASGIAMAAAINKSTSDTGVTAEVNATVVNGGATRTSVGDDGIVTINGVATATITTIAGQQQANTTAAIDAINLISGQTGVVASDNGVSITLTAADGRNISVAVTTNTGGDFDSDIGLDDGATGIGGAGVYTAVAVTTSSTVRLTSAGSIDLKAGSTGRSGVTELGFVEGVFGGSETGQFLNEVDVSTIAGSEKALAAVDNALDMVSRETAKLGAIQNRLDSAVAYLAVNSTNVSEARSRIMDADFAAEAAELSRTQVLQQAGMSILAQANAQPQQVLSLLQ